MICVRLRNSVLQKEEQPGPTICFCQRLSSMKQKFYCRMIFVCLEANAQCGWEVGNLRLPEKNQFGSWQITAEQRHRHARNLFLVFRVCFIDIQSKYGQRLERMLRLAIVFFLDCNPATEPNQCCCQTDIIQMETMKQFELNKRLFSNRLNVR